MDKADANQYGRPMFPALENWTLFLQGNVLFRLEKWDEAQATFAALLQRAPEQAIAPRQLEMIRDWHERCQFAREYVKDPLTSNLPIAVRGPKRNLRSSGPPGLRPGL